MDELTPAEHALASKLGYSEKVLDEIKATLDPDMGLVKCGGVEEPDNAFVELKQIEDPHIPQDQHQYLQIAATYPELQEIVDMWSRIDQPPKPLTEPWKRPDYAKLSEAERTTLRQEWVSEVMRKYAGLMLEESNAAKITGEPAAAVAVAYSAQPSENGIAVPNGPLPAGFEIYQSDQKTIDYLREIERRYAGKQVKPENQGRNYLGLRYFSSDTTSPPADLRIAALNEKLMQSGYRIIENSCIERIMQFESKKAAEEFAKSNGITQETSTFEVQQPRAMEVIYPIDWKKVLDDRAALKTIVLQQDWSGAVGPTQIEESIDRLQKRLQTSEHLNNLMSYFVLYPGASLKKSAEGKWLMEVPERCQATFTMHSAIVLKEEPGPGFEILRLKRTSIFDMTSKPPRTLETAQIIERLKDFDKQYGLRIVDADFQEITLQFTHLPADIKPLCRELFEYFPVFAKAEDAGQRSAKEQALEETLLKTKQIFLNWDAFARL